MCSNKTYCECGKNIKYHRFDVDEMVYLISQISAHIKCRVCDGSGKIELSDGKKYNCPACSGFGKAPDMEWKRRIGKVKITDISISRYRLTEERIVDRLSYLLVDENNKLIGSFKEEDLFYSASDAEAQCKIRNNEEKANNHT